MKRQLFIIVAIVLATSNSWAQRVNKAKSASVPVKEVLSTNVSDDNQSDIYEVVNASSVNIRSAATTSSKIVGKLKKGETITVLSISNGWARFRLEGKDAFVSSRYLKKIETEGPLDESQTEESSTVQTMNVVEANEEVPMQTVAVADNKEVGDNSFMCMGLTFFVNEHLKQLAYSIGMYNPDNLGFEMRTRFHLRKSLTGLVDFMPNYTLSLVNQPNSSNGLFLVTSVGANIGLYEYGDKTKFTYGFVFSPSLLFKTEKIAISAGYNMDVSKFKFKKESLLHSFSVSLYYCPWS